MKTRNGSTTGLKQYVQKTVIEECKKGWRDGLWSFYFSLYLLPWCFIASFLDRLIYDRAIGQPPGPIGWTISGIGAVYALYKAFRKTGKLTDEQQARGMNFVSRWYNKILNRRKG